MIRADDLRLVDAFTELTDDQLAEIASLCHEEVYEPGAILLREGQAAETLYILKEGKVALEMSVQVIPQGPTQASTVEVLNKAGDLLGWSALVEPHVYTLSARSLERTRVMAIDGRAFHEWLDRECRVGYRVNRGLSRAIANRLVGTRRQLTRLLQETELAQAFRPEETELLQRIHHFIQLRWLAVIGVIATTGVVDQVLRLGFPTGPVYGVACAIALYNCVFLLWARRLAQGEVSGIVVRARRFANLQIAVDLLALTVLLHFSGGVENPFLLFYVFHIINASLLLPVPLTYIQTTLAVVLFGSMAGLEYLNILPHVHLEGFLPDILHRQGAYVGGILGALVITLYVAAYMATSIVRELRHREAQIVALKDRVTTEAQQLEQANSKLVEVDRLKTYFLGMVSHDLKSPLVAIESYLQVLMGGFAGEITTDQKEILERSSLRIRDLLNLIGDLLDITRIESGLIAQEFKTVDLAQVIAKSVEDVRAAAQVKGVSLNTEIPALPPIQVAPGRLQQVVTNLLSNAVKFTSSGGKVTVAARELKELEELRAPGGVPSISSVPSVVVSVTDTGTGIAPEDLPNLFQDFYRGRGVAAPGTGLGLSIARKLVVAHGGQIWAESPPAGETQGSRFTFTLPVTALPPSSQGGEEDD